MAISEIPPVPLRSDAPDVFIAKAEALMAALAKFRTEVNAVAAAMNLGAVTANSATTLTIGTGSKSLTVDIEKSYVAGMSVKIASTANGANWMLGDVTAYNSVSGALVVNVSVINGSGAGLSAWTISQSAPGGALPGANTDITSLLSPFLNSATADTQAINDASTKVATTAYADRICPRGAVIAFTGSTMPAGFIQLFNAPQSLSTTTYAALFAIIGYTWGGSGGSFNIPGIPANYTLLQGYGGIGLAGSTTGDNKAHSHTVGVDNSGGNTGGGAGAVTRSGVGSTNTSTDGSAANYPAGVGFNFAIRY